MFQKSTIFGQPSHLIQAGRLSLRVIFKTKLHKQCCTNNEYHYDAIIERQLESWKFDIWVKDVGPSGKIVPVCMLPEPPLFSRLVHPTFCNPPKRDEKWETCISWGVGSDRCLSLPEYWFVPLFGIGQRRRSESPIRRLMLPSRRRDWRDFLVT